MKRILFIAVALILSYTSFGQVFNPVKWALSVKQVNNDEVDLNFKASIASPWHMYGLNIPDGGPMPASINFTDTAGFLIVGKTRQTPAPEIVYDNVFNMKVELHNGQVTYIQRIKKLSSDSILIKGTIDYQVCSDMRCIPGSKDFFFHLGGLEKKVTSHTTATPVKPTVIPDTLRSDSTLHQAVVSVNSKPTASTPVEKKSLWGIFFLSIVLGLGGLLTPCVYPMIPLTVSFFLRGNKSRTRAISEALVFGLSIVLIYTLIGVVVAVFKNPNAVNNVTTYWLTNLIFFLIFLLLAASFFGMFEITLPSGIANRVDQQADKGGYLGAFFMALAMAILSFSCTGPIVASLLIKASEGQVLEPIVGMAGFSVIFALPFTLFAIFPSWLQSLPKSGGWLNAVKVFFAFVMLAFSLYFLGKIDQTYHLKILSRELFLSVWVVIFVLLGFYLLGKIKFAHDSDLASIGVPRFLFALASFSFALYLFTGFLGNDLKGLSSILPPKSVNAFINTQTNPVTISDELCDTPKYATFLDLPQEIEGYFDYTQALDCAKKKNKPILVDFVGHTCGNCKIMYAEVWSDPQIIKILRDKFVVVALYTDDRTKLPENDWVTSDLDHKVKNTIGRVNQDFEIEKFNSNALPLYAIVSPNGKILTDKLYTYNTDIKQFIGWLDEGLANYGE